MTIFLALLLFIGVGAVAVAHALWALGSHWPASSEDELARRVVGDGRRRMPPAWQCLLVAAILAAVAFWPWFVLGSAGEPTVSSITYVIAGVFVARGVAGYSVRWRQHFVQEPFATYNRRYYSPYCLLLGVGYVALLSGELGI